MLLRDRKQGESWMAVGVCILACLQITSAWSSLRTLQNQQSDMDTSRYPLTYDTESAELERLQDGVGQLQQNNQGRDNDRMVVDIAGQGPLSDVQMHILETLLRRHLENGEESPEVMFSNLVRKKI